jgi:transcription antitermination factor NusG
MRGWAVVHTHPQAERWAQSQLQRIGYETYLPLYASQRRDPDRTVLRPLFPRYCFVQLDPRDPWTPIRYAPGVRDLLMRDGRPDMARPGVVSALQAFEDVRRCPTPANASWAPGMRCRPRMGVLSGMSAVVLAIHHETARIAVMFLGHLREISLHVDCLMACDDA